ncbi:uncharacterized protein LOC119316509 [Triticum dicoccoides]|uniref:uncharacterized protein LOC119316509 n=1 Tax=Triticum dicoccoides TaxID=85692 RepID=UPI001890BFDD|nr:uncharacterized protein LOC119316509 [Triticum dicoccoides]
MTGGWYGSTATKRSPDCSCSKSTRTCPGLLRSKIPCSTADCHAYMSPPVPDAYAGNCVALCMASLSRSELAAVREAIAEAKREQLHDLARWRTKFAVIQRGRRGSRVRAGLGVREAGWWRRRQTTYHAWGWTRLENFSSPGQKFHRQPSKGRKKCLLTGSTAGDALTLRFLREQRRRPA